MRRWRGSEGYPITEIWTILDLFLNFQLLSQSLHPSTSDQALQVPVSFANPLMPVSRIGISREIFGYPDPSTLHVRNYNQKSTKQTYSKKLNSVKLFCQMNVRNKKKNAFSCETEYVHTYNKKFLTLSCCCVRTFIFILC